MYDVTFSSNALTFIRGKVSLKDYIEPEFHLDFESKNRSVLIKNSKIEKISSDTILFYIQNSCEYIYDHQNILRKKLTIKFEGNIEEFITKYNSFSNKCKEFRYYSNGILKSKGDDDNYEEFYNKPGYKIRFKGEVIKENHDVFYKSGTFYNERQNIQMDFMEINNNTPEGEYNIFLYDDENTEIYYETKNISDLGYKLILPYFNIDEFAEDIIPNFNKIIIRTENEYTLLTRVLEEIYTIKEQLNKEKNQKRGWLW